MWKGDGILYFWQPEDHFLHVPNKSGHAKGADSVLLSEEKYFAILMDRASGGGCSTPMRKGISPIGIGEISGTFGKT